jgi:UDP-galactopyranose mutase
MSEEVREATLARLLDAHVASIRGLLIAWYYTPMMLPFSRHITPDLTVYDAMDELSKFKFAPEHLLSFEQELIDRADILFTGGSSLYEAKKDRHENVHCFPSSVDRCHFAKARVRQFEPADQEDLPKPRLGFYGVIDERFDTELLAKAAEMRPDWSFVMLGPVVKIADEDLPRRHNIHYLGSKTYEQLPSYLSGWDVALMPFAMNESTEFISPTKTPEYLAGGKPVVSTQIASTVEQFVAGCEKALELSRKPESGWLAEADLLLSATSWDITQARMAGLVHDLLGTRAGASSPALMVAAE